jgi:acetyl-CoA acetyltransferase
VSAAVCIVGIGIHPFGRTPGLSGLEQGVHAVRAALGDAGVDWADIQFAYGGSDAAGNPDSMVSHLGLTGVQFINVRNGCATGGSALFSAQMAIRSGEFELGLALGFDKHPRGAFNALPAEYNLPEWYGAAGYMVTTQFFAAKIMRYMHLHGISRRTLGLVAEKAFANGVHAPHAWRREPVALDTILDAPMVSDPFTKFMFCSPGEGAVALVLASERKARELGVAPIRLAAATMRTRPPGSFEVFAPSIATGGGTATATRLASAAAFEAAGIGPTISPWRSCRTPKRARRSCTWPRTAFAPMAIRKPGWPMGAPASTARCRSTPMAVAWPVANRSAHRACVRSMKTSCNCAARAAGGKCRATRAPPTATSMARRASRPSPSCRNNTHGP